jgi:hypothetical protein
MKKILAILPLVLAGCPAAAHRADENHRHGQPGFGLLSAIRRYPGSGANAAGRSTQCKLPSGETLDEWALWRRDHPAKS